MSESENVSFHPGRPEQPQKLSVPRQTLLTYVNLLRAAHELLAIMFDVAAKSLLRNVGNIVNVIMIKGCRLRLQIPRWHNHTINLPELARLCGFFP